MSIRNTLIIILLVAFGTTQAQEKAVKKGTVVVEGTSTMHDWEMTSAKATGKATLAISGSQLTDLSNLQITIPVQTLKSEKESMDDNAYDALKENKNKNITFQQTTAATVSAHGSGYLVKLQGKLSIAGAVKTIPLEATCTVSGGTVQCKGEKAIKMTDYGVEPPTMMFGSIKTGDELTIKYDITF